MPFSSSMERLTQDLSRLPSTLRASPQNYYTAALLVLGIGFLAPRAISIFNSKPKSQHEESTTAPFNDDTPCRYRLDLDAAATITLPDGRKLGYYTYGLVTASRTIIYCHGFPGSGMEAAMFDTICTNLATRIIGIDRPGYGLSTPNPNATILSHIADISHLITKLNITTYTVLGISGGGPYALACASALPSPDLRAVSLVCGLGPPDIGYRGARFLNRVGFSFGMRWSPTFIFRWFFGREPAAQLHLSDQERYILFTQRPFSDPDTHPKDKEALRDVEWVRCCLAWSRQIYSQGFDQIVQDGKLLSSDFGFRVEDIRKDLPVQLWYGGLDKFVPPRHGIVIAERLGKQAKLNWKEDETHLTILRNWEEKILEDLVQAME